MFGRESLRELIRRQYDELAASRREDEKRWEERSARWEEEAEERRVLRKEESEQRDAEAREREARLDAMVDGLREFNREILLRNEKVYTDVLAQLHELTEQTREDTRQLRENTAETRAQREAVLRLLDRFGEPGDKAA